MMRTNTVTLAILIAILAAPLRGEVIESTATGFVVRNTAVINAPPATIALTVGLSSSGRRMRISPLRRGSQGEFEERLPLE